MEVLITTADEMGLIQSIEILINARALAHTHIKYTLKRLHIKNRLFPDLNSSIMYFAQNAARAPSSPSSHARAYETIDCGYTVNLR